MPGADTVAEEAPVLIELDLLLSSVLAWIGAWGLYILWSTTIGLMLVMLANALRIDAWGIHIDPLAKLRTIDTTINGWLQTAIAHSDYAIGYWFHQIGTLQLWIAQESWAISKDVLHFGEWAVHHYGPMLLQAATTVVFPWPAISRVIHQAIAAELPTVRKWIRDGEHTVTHTITRVIKYAIPAAVPGAIALPWLVKEWRGLTKRNLSIQKRLTKLEGITAAGVFAGLLANSLGITTRCVRSGNVGKTVRRLCGLDNLIMDALLADLAFTAGTISIVAFAKSLQKAAPLVATSMVYFVDEMPVTVKDAEAMGKRALQVLESLA